MLPSNKPLPEITILTTTFNRRHLLPRLYHSLVTQELPLGSFEWLVVDDGSTDATAEWLEGLAAEAKLPLRVLVQANSGKCAALNRGVKAARGKWLMIVDSDDFVLPDGVKNATRLTKEATRLEACVIFCLQDNSKHNCEFKNPEKFQKFYQWINSDGGFDSVQIFLIRALLRHPYPVATGEKFMAESWLFHQFDKNYHAIFRNIRLVKTEYQPGGLSDQSRSLRAASPVNALTVYEAELKSKLRFYLRCRAGANYFRYLLHAKRTRAENRQNIPLKWLLMAPLGSMLFVHDLLYLRRARMIRQKGNKEASGEDNASG